MIGSEASLTGTAMAQAASQPAQARLDVELLVVVIVLGAMSVGGWVLMAVLWRSEADRPSRTATDRRWSFSQAVREAYVRTLPIAFITITFMWFGLVALLVRDLSSGRTRGLADTLGNWFATLAFASLPVHVTVTLFNRPKFVVPPAARDEPGALTLWWRSRRHRPRRNGARANRVSRS